MKLIKTNKPQVREDREVPGLLRCKMDYEIKAAHGNLDYAGPKLAPEVWHQALSFFRWTHAQMQSESQIRLYVNYKLGRWGAWAFPQAARTGLSARELPVPETPDQARERFASWGSEPSDDWLYFGTAHHHCALSAFQSSTDEQNECNQDGLHITVGNMDSGPHDLHARFYLGGNCFEPDLSLFWPMDSDLAGKVPRALHHELARFQMGQIITMDFPAAWRANVVEIEIEPRLQGRDDRWDANPMDFGFPEAYRAEMALEEICQRCACSGLAEEQWTAALQTLCSNDASQFIIEACLRHGVTPDEILKEMKECSLEFLTRH